MDLERFDAVSHVVQDSRTWMDLKQIVSLSGVSLTHCKVILSKLIECGEVSTKTKQSTSSPHAIHLYAKKSIGIAEERQQSANSVFKYAKSRFELRPELLDGKTHQIYAAKPNQLHSLAMLSRRA